MYARSSDGITQSAMWIKSPRWADTIREEISTLAPLNNSARCIFVIEVDRVQISLRWRDAFVDGLLAFDVARNGPDHIWIFTEAGLCRFPD